MNKALALAAAPMRLAFKALTSIRHSVAMPLFTTMLKRTSFDYKREVGTGIDASVVTAPVQWVQRALPEARLRMMKGRGDKAEEVDEHELVKLVNNPNPYYGGALLWAITVLSWFVAGNCYWLIVRNGNGRPAQLWWIPWWCIEPKWPQDGSEFITHYEYRPAGSATPTRLEVRDVVHFRHGIDPFNMRMGISPLHGALREIFMDLESSNFAASLLRNQGVPGVVLSPDGGSRASDEDVKAVKAWFKEAFGGDNRGDALVMSGSTKLDQFGFNPQQMDLSVTRDVAEERVCACIGIPAAVVGFGAGLETAKVGATMNELCRLAWSNGVLPLLRALADELNRSLLPHFRPDSTMRLEWDVAGVVALEDELETRVKAWDTGVRGGWITVADAKKALGLDVEDADRVYLRSFSIVEVPIGVPPRSQEQERDADPIVETDDDGSGKAALPGRWSTKAGFKQNRVTPSPAQEEFVAALERMAGPLADAMEPRLVKLFKQLGLAAEDEAASALAQEVKATGEDEVLIGRILETMGLDNAQRDFQQIYEAHYVQVAEEVAKAGELVGIGTNLPDAVARTVAAAGGRRSGLVDLSAQSRKAMFKALAEGRAAGEGAEQLAARIARHVEGGPWRTPETRARIIARTETKYAQNVSTVARGRDAGVSRFVIFDGRLGPERSKPDHIERHGTVVTADEAQELAAQEHPNGTLSFSPHFELEEAA